MTPYGESVMIEKGDAPEGYIAIPKSAIQSEHDPFNFNQNYCNFCDHRKPCIDGVIHPCMSYARKDGISVLFKKVLDKK